MKLYMTWKKNNLYEDCGNLELNTVNLNQLNGVGLFGNIMSFELSILGVQE